MDLPGDTILNVEINLEIKKLNNEEIISKLCEKINYLEKEIVILKNNINENTKNKNENDIDKIFNEQKLKIKELEKGINDLKNKNNDLNTKIDILIKWNNKVEKNLDSLIKINENMIKLYDQKIDPKILSNLEELSFINNRIKQKRPNSNISFHLLYRATKDGQESKIFHQKCDNARCTVSLVKTKKGIKSGGFTEEYWSGNNTYKKDNNSFIFSLDKRKIYNIKQDYTFCIGCFPYYGPIFGNYHFWLFYQNSFKKGTGYNQQNSGDAYNPQFENYELSDGENKFDVEEVEIFEIKFN